MDYSDFVNRVNQGWVAENKARDHIGPQARLRYGQVLWAEIHNNRPDLELAMKDSGNDPFYVNDDTRMAEIWTWIGKNW